MGIRNFCRGVKNHFSENLYRYIYGGIIIAAFGGLALGISEAIKEGDVEMKEKARRQIVWKETSDALKKARFLSSGKDRIWQDSEKRKFLDDLDFKDTVLGSSQNIYFRRSKEYENTECGGYTFWVRSPDAVLVIGYNMENNGGVLRGSSANSGTVVGTVDLSRAKKVEEDYNSNR